MAWKAMIGQHRLRLSCIPFLSCFHRPRFMNLNSHFFARTVRRLHRGQSVYLPFFQSSSTPTNRDQHKWYNSRSEIGHSTQHVRFLDIKSISIQETDVREDMSISLSYTDPKSNYASIKYNANSSVTGIIDEKMDIDLSLPESTSEKRIASGISPYDIPTQYEQPDFQNVSNGSNTGSQFNNNNMDTSEGYKSFTRGLKATVSTTKIQTTTTETSPYFSSPPKFFSRATASAIPSLIYSLPLQKSPIDDLPDRDWNKEFNEVLESPLLERAEKLRKLEKEFVEVASMIGKVIISEKNIHPSQKTIKAISVDSGFAGGEKYQVKGIFFKFAVDKSDLYGSDEHAMKVACHELKGHTALVSCGMVHGLKLGLMTVIDYQGSRLTAVSVLPISRETLVYGSSDAGRVVCSSLEAMNDVMRQCGKVLNLKGHLAGVGEDKKFIFGPCDLEGHLGHDGRLYAIDLARLFPPETPKQSIPGGFLYRLLRPELVRQFPKPLSSDAFTMFGAHDSEKHDAEVRQATEFLHSTVIPEFASSLANEDHHISIDDILVKMHRAGINIRFLGEVRSLVTNLSQRKTLLTEICARVFKNEIRKKLRDSKSTQPIAYSRLCVNFFNTIFGDKPISKTFWQAIKKPILQRFVQALSGTEFQRDFDVRKHVHMEMLFSRLQNALGISFNASYEDLPLSLSHFQEFVVKAKQMYTVPRIEADTAAELARTTKDIFEAKRLLSLACENYRSVLELKPDDHVVLSNLGMVFAESAMLEDGEERKELFRRANRKFDASLMLHGDDPHTLVMWSDVLVNQAILLEDNEGNADLLDRALSMSLKAESFVSGIGSLTIARASSLQGRDKLVQKCLRHAASTNNLPGPDALLHDPAFAHVKNCEWFSSFLEPVPCC